MKAEIIPIIIRGERDCQQTTTERTKENPKMRRGKTPPRAARSGDTRDMQDCQKNVMRNDKRYSVVKCAKAIVSGVIVIIIIQTDPTLPGPSPRG